MIQLLYYMDENRLCPGCLEISNDYATTDNPKI